MLFDTILIHFMVKFLFYRTANQFMQTKKKTEMRIFYITLHFGSILLHLSLLRKGWKRHV
jgi:hypothetical protein